MCCDGTRSPGLSLADGDCISRYAAARYAARTAARQGICASQGVLPRRIDRGFRSLLLTVVQDGRLYIDLKAHLYTYIPSDGSAHRTSERGHHVFK